MHCNDTKFVLLITINMHTYTRARPHSIAWKEANLACSQIFALQRQPLVNRIIFVWEQLHLSLSLLLFLFSSPPTLASINPQQLAHNKHCI